MSLFELLLSVHLISIAIWIGASVGITLVGGALVRAKEADALGKFCGVLEKLGGPLFGGSSLVAGATGIWMVALKGGAEFSDFWVSLGLSGWIASAILGSVGVGRAWGSVGKRLRSGEDLTSVMSLIGRARMMGAVDLLIRLAIVVVMVVRPT